MIAMICYDMMKNLYDSIYRKVMISIDYPLVMTNSLLWKIWLSTVSFPIKSCDVPWLC